MSILKKIAEKIDNVADKKIADTVEKAGIPPKPEPSPKSPPKAGLSIVSPTPMGGSCFVRAAELIGFGGIVAATVFAALFGAAACKVPGQPEPRPPYTEDADKPDYTCGYDGNQLCPSTPPPVKASCDEPAAWCRRGDTAEAAVQG